MEVRIGVRQVAREVVIESDQTPDQVRGLVEAAMTGGTTLSLTDDRGHTVLVPADALGYVEIGAEQRGRVGFGS